MSWYFLTKIKKFFIRLGIGILPLKNKKFLRKKYLALADKKYLRRYLYALYEMDKDTNSIKPNIIWTCWLQGEENAPPIVQTCINSIRLHNPDKTVIVITAENLSTYIDMPDYILKKWHQGIITNTHFSDILRVCLLYQYGGIWLDATVFLGDTIPDAILKAPFFAYHSRTFLRVFPKVLGNNNWFLVSTAKHPLMSGMRLLLLTYWQHENHLCHYFFYHLFFDLMVENNDFCRQLWEATPLYYDDEKVEALYENLQQKFGKRLYNKIIKESPIQKLSYKYDQQPRKYKQTFEDYILQTKE